MIKIIQATDLHLRNREDGRLFNIPTRITFADIVDHVIAHHPDARTLVLTGDLAHDEDHETYSYLKKYLEVWKQDLMLVPGNHDNRAAIRDVFATKIEHKELIVFDRVMMSWRVLGIDSQAPGQSYGELSARQLAWLRQKLKFHTELPTMVFLHHHPVAVGDRWLDEIGLKHGPNLMRMLSGYPQVKAVFCGHIHREFAAEAMGISVYGTPATSLQFKSGPEPQVDEAPPGYRVIEVEASGSLKTYTQFLPERKFTPDMSGVKI